MKILLIDFIHHTLPKTLLKLSEAFKDHERTIALVGNCQENIVHQATQIQGTAKVHTLNSSNAVTAEDTTHSLVKLCKDFDIVAMPSHTSGRNCLPRLAAALDIAPITNITSILSSHQYQRPIYAGNALETLENLQPKQALTIQTSGFKPLEEKQAPCPHASLPLKLTHLCKVIQVESHSSDRPDLQNADIVVSGGRGLGSKENFQLIESLADQLNGAIGASRAAVDADFVPNDYQVGQTGKIVAPDVYIAVGISGAIQHLAGMKDSQTIIAINKDEQAPIFKIADYGYAGDLFEAVPAIIEAVKTK
ncbi:MAG TPA: FAD-binding protein [Gammaproteobacteria bacterium]|nr:FAD-binding protein [Gammaproteobacteria bacterium]